MPALPCLLLCSCGNAAGHGVSDKSNDKSDDVSFEGLYGGSDEASSAASEITAAAEESGISEEPEVSDVKPKKETTKIAVSGDSTA